MLMSSPDPDAPWSVGSVVPPVVWSVGSVGAARRGVGRIGGPVVLDGRRGVRVAGAVLGVLGDVALCVDVTATLDDPPAVAVRDRERHRVVGVDLDDVVGGAVTVGVSDQHGRAVRTLQHDGLVGAVTGQVDRGRPDVDRVAVLGQADIAGAGVVGRVAMVGGVVRGGRRAVAVADIDVALLVHVTGADLDQAAGGVRLEDGDAAVVVDLVDRVHLAVVIRVGQHVHLVAGHRHDHRVGGAVAVGVIGRGADILVADVQVLAGVDRRSVVVLHRRSPLWGPVGGAGG